MRALRNTAIVLASGLLALYVAVFAVLVVWQRDILFIGSHYAAAKLPRGSIYRSRTIRESDGTNLTLWQALPAQAGKPVIVFFYGNGGTLLQFTYIGEQLRRQGFGIVLASYRGYSGNPGLPSEDGLMADARAVLASLPPGPKVLWGQSLGTGVVARMAAEGRADALILQSPYTAIVDVAAWRFPVYPVRMVMRDRFDTASLLPRIKVPVLILSGTADPVVPYDMGVTLAHRFGKQAQFVSIAGGTHDLTAGEVLPPAEAWLWRKSGTMRAAP